MTLLACFDVDGVLADTHELVQQSYAVAGVDMPPDAWGRPWREWLLDICAGDEDWARHLHAEKTAAYCDLIHKQGVKELPAAEVVRELVAHHRPVALVTSASRPAVLALVRALHIPEKTIIAAYLSNDVRTNVIKHWANGHTGIYFDDLPKGEQVASGIVDWTFHHVTEVTTADDIRKALSWTL